MSAPTPLRQDFDAPQVRGLARKTKDGPQARRLLALAAIYDGATRTEAAKIGGVGLQIIRDWVLRFNARGPDGLLDGKSTGQPSKLNDTQRQAIAGMIESGPIPAVHGVVRWRLIDLAQWGRRSAPMGPRVLINGIWYYSMRRTKSLRLHAKLSPSAHYGFKSWNALRRKLARSDGTQLGITG